MTVFRYGDPSGTSQLLGPRPPCWGTSKYDNEDRECRACGFQNTCRDQAIKSKTAAPAPVSTTAPVSTAVPAPVASYFSQFQPQSQYATPQVIQAPQPPPAAPQVIPVKPAPQAPIQAPTQVRTVVQQPTVVNSLIPVIDDRYGQFQDPLFSALKGTPSVMRPQLGNENFVQRVAKNMLLASVESALGELLLGVRQFLWAPKNDKENK